MIEDGSGGPMPERRRGGPSQISSGLLMGESGIRRKGRGRFPRLRIGGGCSRSPVPSDASLPGDEGAGTAGCHCGGGGS